VKQAIIDSLENSNQEMLNLVSVEVNEFKDNVLSNVIFWQNASYNPVLGFSDDDKAKNYVVRILEKVRPLLDNDYDKNEVDIV
jgi:hypothetical protein